MQTTKLWPVSLYSVFPNEPSTTTAVVDSGELVVRSTTAGAAGVWSSVLVSSSQGFIQGVGLCASGSNARTKLRAVRLEQGAQRFEQQLADPQDNDLGSDCQTTMFGRACLGLPTADPVSLKLDIDVGDPSDSIRIQSLYLVFSE